jgi:hypothetical protein
MIPATPEQAMSPRFATRAWRGVGILVGLLAMLTVMLAFLAGREPRYQGRSLSSWLVNLDPAKPESVRVEARLAVQQIGTDALPTLKRWTLAAERNGGIRVRVAGWLFRLSGGRINWIPTDRRELATRGYEALGTRAEPAAPELIALLRDEASRDQAARALVGIGSPSVGPLISCLSSDDHEVRRLAIVALGAIAAQPERCVPALLARLAQTNDSDTIRSLGEFGDAALVALPQLAGTLTNGGPQAFDSAYALAQMGGTGLPPLIRGLSSRNSDVRRASAGGVAWHNSLPRVQGMVGESRLGTFLGRCCLFNTTSLRLAGQFYSEGEAATFMPLVSPHLRSTNAEVREAAVAVTSRLAQLPPQKKRPLTQPPLPYGSTRE